MSIDISFYTRQIGLIDPEKLTQKIAIIGAGGIGSWTTLALLKMGCQHISVFDFDKVEEHNIGSQLYGIGDIGKTKVQAVIDRLQSLTELLPTVIEKELTPENIAETLSDFDIVISAVDSIDVRRDLYSHLPSSVKWFIDGRMAGNAIEIYTINNPTDMEFYDTTLFKDTDSLPVACSASSVIYNTFVISGLIADIISQITNEKVPPKELVIDLTNFKIYG